MRVCTECHAGNPKHKASKGLDGFHEVHAFPQVLEKILLFWQLAWHLGTAGYQVRTGAEAPVNRRV
jgi:hypothetical protein